MRFSLRTLLIVFSFTVPLFYALWLYTGTTNSPLRGAAWHLSASSTEANDLSQYRTVPGGKR